MSEGSEEVLMSRPEDDRVFDTMLRLLIMLESELQLKETVIDILMEGRYEDKALLKKLSSLNEEQETDPFLALKRDNIYNKDKWCEFFVKCEHCQTSTILSDSSRYLSACSSLRAVNMARIQHQRHCETYDLLQKTRKSYKKLKVKYHKERSKVVGNSNDELRHSSNTMTQEVTTDDVIQPPEVVKDTAQERITCQLAREKERSRDLQQKLTEMNERMTREHYQARSIEKQMREEIRRLGRELRQERENARKNTHCKLFITTAKHLEPLKIINNKIKS